MGLTVQHSLILQKTQAVTQSLEAHFLDKNSFLHNDFLNQPLANNLFSTGKAKGSLVKFNRLQALYNDTIQWHCTMALYNRKQPFPTWGPFEGFRRSVNALVSIDKAKNNLFT